MRSDPTLRRWYRKINRRFFDGHCSDRVCVRYAHDTEEKEKRWEKKYFGWADHHPKPDRYHDYVIVLSRKKMDNTWSLCLSTLSHEMIHIATELRDDHGPAFEYWRQFIADKGIFKKHALHKNMTIF